MAFYSTSMIRTDANDKRVVKAEVRALFTPLLLA